MNSIEQQFQQAQIEVKTLTAKPNNNDLLHLYSHFKQATEGDCKGERPGMMDFVARAKYDAWQKLSGMGKDDAMQNYISKVKSLLG